MVKENELKRHVFKDTGRVVFIKKVSPLLLAQIGRDFPPPRPPKQKVDYGDGDIREEENPSHPDHVDAMGKYFMELEEKSRSFVIKRGVVVTLTEEDKEEIDRVREDYKEEIGVELRGSDKMVYVSHICIGSPEDMEELLRAINGRSEPTNEEVAAAKDTFQGDLQGP
jgi:hypothetical protein